MTASCLLVEDTVLSINGTSYQCGTTSLSPTSTITIFGNQGRIAITNAEIPVNLKLNGVDLQGSDVAAILVSNSVLNLEFAGTNTLVTTTNVGSGDSAAIDCRDNASITFTNGNDLAAKLIARGSGYGPAIGSGAGHSCAGLTFNGGTYEAYAGNHAAAIGSATGMVGNQSSHLGKLEFVSGDFLARANEGAAIGGGAALGASTGVVELRISGGTFDVTVSGSGEGAAIGAGWGHSGTSTVSNLVIEGGSFSVSAARAAGIGAGGGASTVGNLTIRDGFFRAMGGSQSAAIGAVAVNPGSSRVESVRIEGGTFTLAGYCGFGGTAGLLTLGSPASRVEFTASTAGAFAGRADRAILAAGEVRGVTNSRRFFDPQARSDGAFFYGQYTVDPESEVVRGGFSIELQGLAGLFTEQSYTLVFGQTATGWVQSVPFNGITGHGFIATMPEAGTYTIMLIGPKGTKPWSLVDGDSTDFVVGAGGLVVASQAGTPVEEGGGLGAGAISGITIAAVVVVVIVIVLLVLCLPPEYRRAIADCCECCHCVVACCCCCLETTGAVFKALPV
jgi:hypothetical protein